MTEHLGMYVKLENLYLFMYNECIYVSLLTVYWEALLPIVLWNKLLKLLKLLYCLQLYNMMASTIYPYSLKRTKPDTDEKRRFSI